MLTPKKRVYLKALISDWVKMRVLSSAQNTTGITYAFVFSFNIVIMFSFSSTNASRSVESMLKEKTKAYVKKLREDHHAEVDELRQLLAQREESSSRVEAMLAATERDQAADEQHLLQRKLTTLERDVSSHAAATAELVAQRDDLQSKHFALATTAAQLESQLQRARQLREHESAAHSEEMQELREQVQALRSKESLLAGKSDEQLTLRAGELTAALFASEHAHSRLQSDFKAIVATKQSLEQELDRVRHSMAEQARLASAEAESNREMKKKMKAYVEALMAEKNKLTADHGQVSSEKSSLMAKNAAMEQNFSEEEAELRALLDAAGAELSASRAAVAQRDKDIAYMKASMSSHGVTAEEQIAAIQREKDQMRVELEDHKAKRFAARNEMITFAQTLERAHADMKEFKYLIQQDLSPLVLEHIAGIESALTGLEMAYSQLSSSKASPTFSPINWRRSVRHEGGGAHGSGTADALHHLQVLRQDIVRAQTGITLLSSAALRLLEHTTRSRERSCCAALASLFRQGGIARGRPTVEANRGSYDRVTMDTSLGSMSPQGGGRSTITSEDADAN